MFEHGEQPVAAGGREVFAQADAVDEIEVGFEYFEAFGGTLETGEVLDTKDPYDKKR